MFVPEILAPAGSEESLRAAVENGADAVYFGLKSFSARARAVNFAEDELEETMRFLRRRGVKGYVTLNTLVFDQELSAVERAIRACAEAGVDALIVQDLGLARLAHAISPDLPLHASTQMTLSSAEGIALAESLGVKRVVLARELSVEEISQIHQQTSMELEVFVHGALCVAYSGQCLTSEAWGGRSANRGECAQACRQPYTMFSDGEKVDTQGRAYLLSPQDLQATPLVPALVQAGVRSFKIEGRLKRPEYVAATTAAYRKAVDLALRDGSLLSEEENRSLAQTFSRGASLGFLGGVNHQVLVEGKTPSNRGVQLGTLLQVRGKQAIVSLQGTVRRGDGIVFEGDNYEAGQEGGRVFEVVGGEREGEGQRGEMVALAFGVSGGPMLQKLRVGCRVFKTDDPQLDKQLRSTFEVAKPRKRVPLQMLVSGSLGTPLRLRVTDSDGHVVEAISEMPLQRAEQRPLTEEVLREQLGRLGDVAYTLDTLVATLDDDIILPLRELNRLRRVSIAQLDEKRGANPSYRVAETRLVESLLAEARCQEEPRQESQLTAVCRNTAQIEASLAAGADIVIIDFQDFVGARKNLENARGKGAKVAVATPRIQKPDEIPLHRNIASWQPDAIVVRSLGALQYYRSLETSPELWGDFGLNVSNSLTAQYLLSMGLQSLTPSYDLDREQLLALAGRYGPRLEVTVHQHMPLFHMEHCVFAAFLSKGKDFRDCGRPCEKHAVQLKDPLGHMHPVVADVGCRNTVFSGQAQSAAAVISQLHTAGVRRYRVEFADEDAATVEKTIAAYRAVLSGTREGSSLWKELRVRNQVGVCHGTLYVLS